MQLTLSDGRTLEVRPMWLSERIAIIEIQQAGLAKIEAFQRLAAVVTPAVHSLSWEGSLLDMDELELLALLRGWVQGTEDDALPPAPGRTSETSSPSTRSRRAGVKRTRRSKASRTGSRS